MMMIARIVALSLIAGAMVFWLGVAWFESYSSHADARRVIGSIGAGAAREIAVALGPRQSSDDHKTS